MMHRLTMHERISFAKGVARRLTWMIDIRRACSVGCAACRIDAPSRTCLRRMFVYYFHYFLINFVYAFYI